ncbi:MAG: iron-sulfur cluster carrier protein ApbC [Cytophagales bacterium]|nr:MAG: iron-sulfur cluster carrier protein ApbC [Cytophagales bacterium]
MTITKDQILAALATVPEPDLKKDLVTLNMIKDIKIDGLNIYFTVILTTPACPLKELIKKNCIEAIHRDVNSEANVVIEMIADVTSIRLGNTALLPGVKNIIAIASGKGGVGKSTVTCNLAMALSKSGASVGIIDADISGPSIPLMFDVVDERPKVDVVDGKNIIIPIMQYGIKLLSIGFLAPSDSAIVWRGPMASSALKQFIGDADWGTLDYLLFDLPPGTSDIHLTLVQNLPVTGAIIVTTPQKVALADANKGLAMFAQPQINVPILGVIENMSYFTPAELPDNKYYIFGKNGGKELAEKHQVPFLGEIPLVQSIRESGDSGRPEVMNESATSESFQHIASQVAQQVALRNANIAPTERVQIKI